jgi:hypothetical protein
MREVPRCAAPVERAQEIEGLEDKADFPVSDMRQLIVFHLADEFSHSTSTRPLVGVSRQPIRFINVDLPDPDGP